MDDYIDAYGFGRHYRQRQPPQPIEPRPAVRVNVGVDVTGFGEAHFRALVESGMATWELTAEQRDERRRRNEQRREAAQAAEDRAKELLMRLLTPEQRDEYDTTGCFHARGASGRRYMIDCRGGYSGNIIWSPPGGQPEDMGRFCIYPGYYGAPAMMLDAFDPWLFETERLPRFDAFLGQKLLIEHDEATFLRIGVFAGRVHPTWGTQRGRHVGPW